MTDIQPQPSLPNLRSRKSKPQPIHTKAKADAKYSPSAESSASLSSVPSSVSVETETETVEEQEKKYDDPYPDFMWMTTEEPHRSRRMAILKAHPEVNLLFDRE